MVAIKLLSDLMVRSDEIKTRFYREAELVRNIRHPNVVRMYEHGEISKRPFLVMEFLRGTDLHTIIAHKARDLGTIDIGRALRIARDACSALAQAHSKGIIHRDVKPENIFIVKDGGTEKVKLIDLGLAKLADLEEADGPKLTKTGHYSGTPQYMAPEMIPEGRERAVFNHRIDVYSIGVTIYEMLTGSLPFESTNRIGMIYNLKTQQPESPQQRRADLDIPDDVNALVMKCLEKDPDRRFQSMDELIDAIDACGLTPKDDRLLEGLRTPAAAPGAKRNYRPLRWIVPLLVASIGAVGGVAYHKLGGRSAPEPAPATQPAAAQVYHAKINTDIPGADVFMEEKLDTGTVVARPLGKTPLEVPLEGEQTIYLELEGYRRAYLRVSPANPSVSHVMLRRD
jgi:serine/threonine-protein kinase